MGVSSALMIPQYVQQMSGNGNVKFTHSKSSKNSPRINLANRNRKMNSAPKPVRKKATTQPQVQKTDWSQKALALWQAGKYTDPNKAVSYWSQAISSKQNTAAAYSNRGLAYHGLKQYQKAVDDYSQAIKLDPDYAAAYNNRGNSYYELNEYKLALKDFDRSLQLKPKYAKAHLNRGLVFYQMDQNAQACNDFQRSCDQGDCDGVKWAMKNGICN